MTCTRVSILLVSGLLLSPVCLTAQSVRWVPIGDVRTVGVMFGVPTFNQHCDPPPPGVKPKPPGPGCPNPTVFCPKPKFCPKFSELYEKLGGSSEEHIMIEYVRPLKAPKVVDIVVGIYDANEKLVGSESCYCHEELMNLREGEAIQFTLKNTKKALRDGGVTQAGLSRDHSIAIGVGFQKGTDLPKDAFTSARSVKSQKLKLK